MKRNEQNSRMEIYKISTIWRVFITAAAICITSVGILWLYDSIVSSALLDIYLAIILIVFGITNVISSNYFRLVLTESSLIQDGIIWKKEVVFDKTVELVSYGDRSFGLFNSSKKIVISKDLDSQLVLVEILKTKIQKMHDEAA